MSDRPQPEPCRSCTCSKCEPEGTKAMAERNDAWHTANKNLTTAVKAWPAGKESSEYDCPITIDSSEVLNLAHWLYSGEPPRTD